MALSGPPKTSAIRSAIGWKADIMTLQHFDSAQLRVVLRADRLKEHGSIIVTLTLSSARTFDVLAFELERDMNNRRQFLATNFKLAAGGVISSTVAAASLRSVLDATDCANKFRF